MAEPVCADQSGSQDTSLLVQGQALSHQLQPAAPETRMGCHIKLLNLPSHDLEKKLCWGKTSKKRGGGINIIPPKTLFFIKCQ